MKIIRVVVGSLDANCYILVEDNKCLVIDPGGDSDKILDVIGDRNPLAILVTHYHPDHIGAIPSLKDKYDCPIYDRSDLEEREYEIDCFKFKVRYNPGHSDDSISFYFEDENALFTGDFVFKGSIGRWDIGGNYDEMQESLRSLKGLDKDITIYPGHGDKTTLFYEKEHNPYF